MTAALPSIALLRRELLTGLRKRRMFFALLAMVVVMAFFVGPLWPREGNFMSSGWVAREIFEVMVFVALFSEALVIPAYTATAILSERQQETYDLLATTLIRPAGIIFGKFANGVGFFAVMLMAMLPVFASLFFLLGVQWRDFGLALAVMAGTAFLCGGVGLYCSTRFQTPAVSVIFSYLVAAFLLGGWFIVCLPLFILLEQWFGTMMFLESWFSNGSIVNPVVMTCPIYTAGMLIDGAISPFELAQHVAYLLTATAVLLALSWWRIRKPREKRRGTWRLWRRGSGEERGRIAALVFGDGWNPVYALELRHGGLTGRRNRRRMLLGLAACAGLYLLVLFAPDVVEHPSNADEMGMVWTSLSMCATGFFGVVMLCNAVTGDLETHRMDLLLLTPMSRYALVFGKWLAGIRAYAGIWLLLVAVALVTVWKYEFKSDCVLVLVVGMSYVLAAGFVSVTLGLLASTLVRHTTFAAFLALLFGAMYHFGLLALFVFVVEVGLDAHIGSNPDDPFVNLVSYMAPLMGFLHNVEPRNPPMLSLQAFEGVVIYGVLALGLFFYASWRFDRRFSAKGGG